MSNHSKEKNKFTKKIRRIIKKAYERVDYELCQHIYSEILDDLIEDCSDINKKCPHIYQELIPFVKDISIEKYINITKKFNKTNPIDIILNCKKVCNLEKNLFLQYTKKICYYEEEQKLLENIKAYWTYKKYKPHNNPITDYEGACNFIEQFHINYLKLIENNNAGSISFNLEDLKKIIHSNLHIMNGFELFESCLIKNLIFYIYPANA